MEKSGWLLLLYGAASTSFGMFLEDRSICGQILCIASGITMVILSMVIVACCLRPFRMIQMKLQKAKST